MEPSSAEVIHVSSKLQPILQWISPPTDIISKPQGRCGSFHSSSRRSLGQGSTLVLESAEVLRCFLGSSSFLRCSPSRSQFPRCWTRRCCRSPRLHRPRCRQLCPRPLRYLKSPLRSNESPLMGRLAWLHFSWWSRCFVHSQSEPVCGSVRQKGITIYVVVCAPLSFTLT